MLHELATNDQTKRKKISKLRITKSTFFVQYFCSDEFILTVILARFIAEFGPYLNQKHIWQSRSLKKVCLLFGFSSNIKATPYFFDNTIKSDEYLLLLQNHLKQKLSSHRKLRRSTFNYEGERIFLQNIFLNHVISRKCEIEWTFTWPEYFELLGMGYFKSKSVSHQSSKNSKWC